VAEGEGDEAEVDAGCEQLGGVSRPQGRQGTAPLVHGGALLGVTAGALDRVAAHRLRGGGAGRLLTSRSGEKPEGVTGSGPVMAQQPQGGVRQGAGAVLGPLASVDMAQHTL
jgi:hypothetical protein